MNTTNFDFNQYCFIKTVQIYVLPILLITFGHCYNHQTFCSVTMVTSNSPVCPSLPGENYKMSYLCNHQGDLDNPYVYYYVCTYPRRIKLNLVTLKGQGQRPSQFQGRFVYTTAQFDVIYLFRFVAIALAIALIHFVTFILILIGLVITVFIILVTLLVHISVK